MILGDDPEVMPKEKVSYRNCFGTDAVDILMQTPVWF